MRASLSLQETAEAICNTSITHTDNSHASRLEGQARGRDIFVCDYALALSEVEIILPNSPFPRPTHPLVGVLGASGGTLFNDGDATAMFT